MEQDERWINEDIASGKSMSGTAAGMGERQGKVSIEVKTGTSAGAYTAARLLRSVL